MDIPKTLYGINQEILFNLLNIDETNELQIAELEKELLVKVDNVASFMEYLDDQVELASAKEKTLKDIKNKLKAKLEWMKTYCIRTMDHAKKDRLIGHNKEIKLKTNPLSVQIEDADKIPPQFIDLKQELVVNKIKILEFVKDTGEQVSGVNIVRNKTIKIKEVLK